MMPTGRHFAGERKTFGHHPLLAFLDRPEIAGGEALAGLLRTGNAGSNTAADHVIVLEQALAALPRAADRPRPRRSRCAEGAGALRHRRGHPQLRRRLPRRRGGVLLRLPRRRPGPGRGGHPQPRPGLVSGDRHRRRHPRRRLGRRGHRPGQPEHLADRDPADPAQGTPPPRRAVAVHRRRRHAGHRVHHRHRTRCRARPGRRPGTAAPSARPRRRPHPRTQGHRPAQPAVSRVSRPTPPGSKSSWPPPIWSPGPNSSDSPTTPSWPAPRSPPSATGSCTSPPASPAAPANYGYVSTPPGAGPPPIATAWQRIRTAFG